MLCRLTQSELRNPDAGALPDVGARLLMRDFGEIFDATVPDLASFSCRIGEVTAAWQLLAPTSAAAAASSSPEFDSMSTF